MTSTLTTSANITDHLRSVSESKRSLQQVKHRPGYDRRSLVCELSNSRRSSGQLRQPEPISFKPNELCRYWQQSATDECLVPELKTCQSQPQVALKMFACICRSPTLWGDPSKHLITRPETLHRKDLLSRSAVHKTRPLLEQLCNLRMGQLVPRSSALLQPEPAPTGGPCRDPGTSCLCGFGLKA